MKFPTITVILSLLQVTLQSGGAAPEIKEDKFTHVPNDGMTWGQKLNTILVNGRETARLMSEHTAYGGIKPDGLCQEERICLYQALDESDSWIKHSFIKLPARYQLMLVVAVSLYDYSLMSLSPIYEHFDDKTEARTLIEAVTWIMGWDDQSGVQLSYELGDTRKVPMDQSRWTKPLMKSKSRCNRCFINMSQRM